MLLQYTLIHITFTNFIMKQFQNDKTPLMSSDKPCCLGPWIIQSDARRPYVTAGLNYSHSEGQLEWQQAHTETHLLVVMPLKLWAQREVQGRSFAWRRRDGRLLEKSAMWKRVSERASAAAWDWQAPAVELRQTNICSAWNLRLWEFWKMLPPPTSFINQSDPLTVNVIQASDDKT